MDEDLLQTLRAAVARSAFHSWAGIDVVEARSGSVTVSMTLTDQHVNLQGLVHGGMLEPGRLHVMSDLDIHFLAPARPGALVGRGRAVKIGRSLAFAEASIEDRDGKLLARAQSRFSVRGREP